MRYLINIRPFVIFAISCKHNFRCQFSYIIILFPSSVSFIISNFLLITIISLAHCTLPTMTSDTITDVLFSTHRTNKGCTQLPPANLNEIPFSLRVLDLQSKQALRFLLYYCVHHEPQLGSISFRSAGDSWVTSLVCNK